LGSWHFIITHWWDHDLRHTLCCWQVGGCLVSAALVWISIIVGLIIVGVVCYEVFKDDSPPTSSVNDFNYERKGWINTIQVCRPGSNMTSCMTMRNSVSNSTMY
jgi:hypothetical protein